MGQEAACWAGDQSSHGGLHWDRAAVLGIPQLARPEGHGWGAGSVGHVVRVSPSWIPAIMVGAQVEVGEGVQEELEGLGDCH